MYKITDLVSVTQAIDHTRPLAFDTETIGKYGKIRLAQFYQEHWDYVLMVERPEPILLMSMLAQLKQTILVMQMAGYDISTIQVQTGSKFIPPVFADTLLLARLAIPKEKKFGLDNLMTVVLGFDPYSNLDKSAMQQSNWNTPILTDQQLDYAHIDVLYLLEVYNAVKHEDSSFSYKLDMHTLRKALDFQCNGMWVDEDRLQELYRHNLKRLSELNMPINVNSWKQVRPYIGSDQSDGLGLATLALQGNTRAREVREARKLLKLNSFLNKFDAQDHKIYGRFGPYAKSGRFTCKEQNLEQLPRKSKGVFGVEENRFMLYADFSQLELRCITAITGDLRMVAIYREGGDIHNVVTEMVNVIRQIAKTINFNGLYGGGAYMLMCILIKEADILMKEADVAKLLRQWKNMFSGVRAWQQRGIRDFQGGRLGSTPLGRKYSANRMTDQLNIENQGFGAEIAKLAMHYMYDDIKKNECEMTNFIHDSYIIDAPNDETIYKEVAKRMAEAMQEAWFEGTKAVQVKDLPMPVTVYGGFNWGDIESGSYTYEYTV